MIALAGGLREDAGDRVTIQRSARSLLMALPSQTVAADFAPQLSATNPRSQGFLVTATCDQRSIGPVNLAAACFSSASSVAGKFSEIS